MRETIIETEAMTRFDTAVDEVVNADRGLLDGLRGVMETEFKDGGELSLPGVGKFSVKNQAERKGRNPKTGAEITIPAGRRVAFSASKGLKDIVNAG